MTNDERTEISIGTCKRGGYGQVLDEEAEAEEGRCHIPFDEVLAKAKE